MTSQKQTSRAAPAGWDPLATWYDGWVGQDGSDHHRQLAIPAVLDLLLPQPGEHILDVGAGQGVLAPYIARHDARYTGIEISPRLLERARQRHKRHGRFLKGDARQLARVNGLDAASFDGAVFLLSIQDMNPLPDVLRGAAWALHTGGRLVIVMLHPCFRVPRQSGWGYDHQRKLQFRRVDRYLSACAVPMKAYGKKRQGVSISFHRPLEEYVNALAACGLLIDCLREITTHRQEGNRAERRAHEEIPLFLALRAWKLDRPD